MSDQKPREFGISNTMSGYRVVDKAPFDGCQFHVIEKSAYDEIERALRIADSEPESRTQEAAHYNWLDDQNQKLRSDLDLAIEALKNIQCDKVNGHTDECRIATRTLAKLQERK